ncbi:FAD-binding oxidoreductase [Ponticoccus sp. SC2-23]|uniref:FAD-binding oxidoreductase n=1 Tax=Alexandriicola marinus TaxID=2081710 RepID=UPI000FDC708A|nr:FAD-binding oxidoreductase [Alexandriicola marinus]MBM1219810.1 FAD-binding oxidoreductase [Ponticoccus sp. SC6-9]MBM1223118.1 FAD-binding oxidoreductase [Ponticoccus sp. SC6-15]MBM1229623.1 FAD-binding oxidoreductase [Ponticoccus sp. SC6-38]MBM1232084.1 FAD-binding oxidoreductase [Ponticoccus sp. SC6-45]MBM1237966.1 FAD-binding oxidoreductase [Ponticoccus sp. SC6-49]MBM1241095.1 FAD-binding oxidoreductase [Ponticoccus sp. SC2-64]MBM1245608.1 FAD-binding oxidoreductase [Ponticoccus sp. SC
MSIPAAIAALQDKGIEVDINPSSVKAKSRDFFWYSPVLKDRLDHVIADFVATPKSEAEVIEILRVCHAEDVPVTTRGTGTGNYGQAMPLAGGCVLHLNKMNAVKDIQAGRVICEPGVLLKDLDAACNETGQEIRMYSSTWATATIGGFIAGGSGGIGSVRWGSLRDPGNIIRLRVVTMEADPRTLEITGHDLHRVSHAYGTNGIITEIEIPLAPAYDWIGIFLAFEDFEEALRYSHALASCDGILIKLATIFEAPIAKDYFQRVAPHVDQGDAVVALMVAPHAMPGWETFTSDYPGARVIYVQGQSDWPRDPGPVFEYGWNHTTLRALKVDPSITYLQIAYGNEDPIPLIMKVKERLSPEVLQHVEVTRSNGKVAMGGLTLVKFTSEERLDEIVAIHEEMGAMNFNPHRYTLEEGGRQSVDERQLEFKREADPKGLLNPGKMITWDDPDWSYDRMYAWPGLQPKSAAE